MLVVDDNATNRRVLELQTGKWGMAPRATESPHGGARLARSGRGVRPRDPRHAHARDGRRRAGARDPRAPRGAAARAVQLARPARGGRRRERSSTRYLAKPIRQSHLFDTLVGPARARRRAADGDRAGQAAARSAPGGAASAAHPARRGQRREPEARAAAAAADGLSRRPGVERHGGHRIGAAADLRRRADGRADARDGRARSLAPDQRALAARRSGRASSR